MSIFDGNVLCREPFNQVSNHDQLTSILYIKIDFDWNMVATLVEC